MKPRLLMLLISCVLTGTYGQEGEKSVNLTLLEMQSKEAEMSQEKDPGKVDVTPVMSGTVSARGQTPTPEPLEEEMNNQENVISQLLGDYDKVRTISSGSDCVCRCIVRPIKRSDCSRMQDGDTGAPVRDVYTVETVSAGKDCKRCECLAPPSAVNPCEGEYRFKKLQEASKNDIKLATIIDLLEGSLYGMDLLKLNSVTTKLLTRVDSLEKTFARSLAEKLKEKERMREKEKEKKSQQKKKKVSDLERMGQKGGSGSANKQKLYEEKQGAKNKTEIQKPLQDKLETKSTIKDKSGLVVKGVTFYKAEEETIKEKAQPRNTKERDVELLVSDELPPTRSAVPPVTTKSHKIEVPLAPTWSTITTTKPATSGPLPRTTVPSLPADVGQPISAAPTQLLPGVKTRLSWTESPADQPMPTKKPGLCKDTVASISEPVQHNTYGLPNGAWMKDARGHGSVIYLTDGHYGNILQEFRDMDAFKSGKPSNSYKLPYSFTGTGHVVFDGAFFYNRAFSRDMIRFDLRRRLVAAWTTLHDALLEEQAHRTHSEVEFAVDESGLWVLYPALDSEGFHQEVILLTHLRPRDLQPIQTFRTGLRRGRYGNSFLVCGVLYAVDNIQHRYANVTYAFDTHTFTHTVPLLAFTSTHQHTAQLSYCPLDKKLYAWDNGHQMMYDVIFAY
ncbi:olfactomedin-like protein 2B [Periophthalmus magnuspinnatus]|uniref:olfactomedin-like protein 2B n=1 Tax=Periophthalmus magnuspinnatus TaxID=409849 RepID=UPI00243724A2|nr:olfactomedin-like protein 2B [Periophthalmus magnuspinnatus]